VLADSRREEKEKKMTADCRLDNNFFSCRTGKGEKKSERRKEEKKAR